MNDETLSMLNDSAVAFASGATGRPADYEGWIADFAAQGWLGILASERHGGLGLGVRHATTIAAALGAKAIRSPFGPQTMVVSCLDAIGTEAAVALISKVVEGEAAISGAWRGTAQRPSKAGSNSLPIVEEGSLTGLVEFAPIAYAQGFLVEAEENAVPVLLHIPRDSPGFAVEEELCADGTSVSTLRLDGVKLTARYIVASGAAATNAISFANRVGLLMAAAELTGVISGAFDLTLDHLRTRRQFGRPIGSFQVLQHRAVDMWLQQQLANVALRGALNGEEHPVFSGDRELRAVAAKARATQAALWVTNQALQLHGAIGFAAEYRLGAFINRVLALAPWLGNASQLRSAYTVLADRDKAQEDPDLSDVPDTTDWNCMSDAEFRATIRKEFEANYPAHLRFPARRLRWSENGDWFRSMAAKGWIAPNWPVEHGGMGLSAGKLLAFLEEQERHGIARYQDHGVLMVGPVLMRYGTAEQQRRFLPPILRCEHIWCQGYSEPDAGSDLASLKTRAVVDGDDYIITGQKIWTTLAQDATHIFVLAKTDWEAKPQRGISFILVEMATPGIRIRPIKDIAGNEEFCEVFFDSVRVPRENLVGAENDGWGIAKSLLGLERIALGSPKLPEFGIQVLQVVAGAYGVEDQPVFKDQLAQLRIDVMHLGDLYGVFAEKAAAGETLGPEVSSLKIVASELFQRIADLIVATAGAAGGLKRVISVEGLPADCLGVFYKSRPATIYGGSNEIQRNILAKSVLNLPAL